MDKQAENLNRYFSKEDTNAQQVYEKIVSQIIREMQISATMKYHLTSVRMAIFKKQKTTHVGKKYNEAAALTCY